MAREPRWRRMASLALVLVTVAVLFGTVGGAVAASEVILPPPGGGGGGGDPPLGAYIVAMTPIGTPSAGACVASAYGNCFGGHPTTLSTPITSQSTGQLYYTQFYAGRSGGSGSYTYRWTFPGGIQYTGVSPVYYEFAYVGTYEVYLTVFSPGYGSVGVGMQVNVQSPTSAPACFSVSQSAGLLGYSASFNECGSQWIKNVLGYGAYPLGILVIIIMALVLPAAIITAIAGIMGTLALEIQLVDQGQGVFLAISWVGNVFFFPNPVTPYLWN